MSGAAKVLPKEVGVNEWPEVLRQLVELIGIPLTRELAAKCGGLDFVYIPTKPRPRHAWAKVLGPEAWQKIVDAFGGQRLRLPMGKRLDVPMKTLIIELASAGVPNRKIALELHVGERWVRRVVGDLETIPPSRQRVEVDPRQMKLFDGK